MKRLTAIAPFLTLSLLLPACSCLKKKEVEPIPTPTEQAQPTEVKKVVIITNTDHFKKELAENKKLVAKFHASWCPHCVGSIPFVEELANKYNSIRFVQIDADTNNDLVQEHQIGGFPTFVVFKDGKQVEVIVGANQPKLTEVVEKLSQETEETKQPA